MAGKLGSRVVLGIPTLSTARRSTAWIEAMASLQVPLGSSLGRTWVEDRPVAEARNILCQMAIDAGADYLVMLGDDVIPPPNMILSMLDKIGREYPVGGGRVARASMITGVYWTKTHPTEPYLWDGLLRGSQRDWTAGEFFPVDLAGCDALMIETSLLREMRERGQAPWFSVDWVWEPGQRPSPIATEDFYFYTKARRAGYRLFADTAIQCLHEERSTGELFGLTRDMPQGGGVPDLPSGVERIAELGPGRDVPAYPSGAAVVRFDADPTIRPDVRCDLRAIPEQHHGQYDYAHARHVLEHFERTEAPAVVAHWAGLLKPGGTLVVRVPNLEWAIDRIRNHDDGVGYAWQQIYGGQRDAYDRHYNGFTARKLRALLEATPGLGAVTVTEEDGGQNLKGEAVYAGPPERFALTTAWDEITEMEASHA